MKFLDLQYIEQQLEDATYDAALGIRIARLQKMTVSEKEITLIAVRLDPGKQLIPHLHEIDGEICLPLSEGLLTLGIAQKDEKGAYKLDADGKVMVDWDTPQQLVPGKPIELLPAIAHHLLAPKEAPVTVLFYLPTTHLGEDRKFVTYPEIKK